MILSGTQWYSVVLSGTQRVLSTSMWCRYVDFLLLVGAEYCINLLAVLVISQQRQSSSTYHNSLSVTSGSDNKKDKIRLCTK